jgi:methylated-DNA-[protein]-cysteine S-methyltransferase
MDLATPRLNAATKKHTPCQPDRFCRFPSQLGEITLAWRGDAVSGLSLAGESLGEESEPPAWVEALIARVQAHLSGETQDFQDVPVDLSGLGPFQRQALVALRAVGPGHTVTYGGLAAQLGRPGAARAVGGAMRRNPIPLIVPCHRVLAQGGGTGGYSAAGGVPTKRRLLEIERVVL